MNDFYGYVVHQDRMADFRLEADASRRAARLTNSASRTRRLAAPRRLAAGIVVAVVAGILLLANSAPVDAVPAGPAAAPKFGGLGA